MNSENFCPQCGSRELVDDTGVHPHDYHIGICGTEWWTKENDVPLFTEPTLACKEIMNLKVCDPAESLEQETFLFEIDGELFTHTGYGTKREGAISTKAIWDEFKLARIILSGFSFSHDGDLEFVHTVEREEALKKWIAIGRPNPFPCGAST